MREYTEIKKDLEKNLLEHRKFIEEIQECAGNGLLEFSQIDNESILAINYPSIELGSEDITVSMQAMVLHDECWNGLNGVCIYDPTFFSDQLKLFFSGIKVDGLNEKQSKEVVAEINEWIDYLPDELRTLFSDTVNAGTRRYRS